MTSLVPCPRCKHSIVYPEDLVQIAVCPSCGYTLQAAGGTLWTSYIDAQRGFWKTMWVRWQLDQCSKCLHLQIKRFGCRACEECGYSL